MSIIDFNSFPNAISPLCAIPTSPDDDASRIACATDTIRNASNMMDALAHGLMDAEAPEAAGHLALLSVTQWALAHALQLLEEDRRIPKVQRSLAEGAPA